MRRVVAALLYLYPVQFRRAFGADMSRDVRRPLARARAGGLPRALFST